MNMKQFLMTTALVAVMSTAALANTTTAPAGKDDKGQQTQQKFDERKAKVLKKMGEHLAKMQEKQACVQTATTPDAMKACFPNRGEWKERHEHGAESEGSDQKD